MYSRGEGRQPRSKIKERRSAGAMANSICCSDEVQLPRSAAAGGVHQQLAEVTMASDEEIARALQEQYQEEDNALASRARSADSNATAARCLVDGSLLFTVPYKKVRQSMPKSRTQNNFFLVKIHLF